MKTEINLQDNFFNYSRQEKVPLTVFLTNGFQLRGIVRGFDTFIILFDCDGKQEMIYKHAISTVIPQRRLDMSGGRRETATA